MEEPCIWIFKYKNQWLGDGHVYTAIITLDKQQGPTV